MKLKIVFVFMTLLTVRDLVAGKRDIDDLQDFDPGFFEFFYSPYVFDLCICFIY